MAIKPPILQPGDTIGVVTLGSPQSAAVINDRIQTLQDLGFQVVLGEHVYAADGFLAGTDEERASDLMNMFADDSVKLILPTRGGVGVAGILPYLDYSFIQENPKLITGYSDITVLLNVLAQYANLITFHSLMLINFSLSTPSYNYDQFFAATSVMTSQRQIENPPEMPQISRVSGNVTGPIVGGNLTSFVDTLGTPYEIDTSGRILLLEDTHEPVNTVYRYMNALKLAGKFEDCIGIVMGECPECPVSYGVTYEDLINNFLVPLGKPLMTNVATAHGAYKATIPIGATVNLNTINNTLTVMESTVS
ncbi:LD-carboxypeptidase [Virgibacillus sp. NKC19-16]|uniref:S66 peptidase family protein n=1 Tax=Virgibacillus salidurans TaxID=2831673 RepID=UPI001F359F2C|nr:LD-carboxypeptidase [Virgibacillus sp. NKC19-16]UJL46718.1 LD-carboxypeptidase [Virgibacillus sp. NKC19-16]